MPIKKTKTTPEAEIVKAADPAPVAKAKTEKSKPAKPAVAPKSSAATHKAPARKPAPRKAIAAAAAAGTTPDVPKAAFDPSAFHAEIAREAYYLWVNRGGGDGQEHEDWLRAIDIVRARHE